MSSEPVVIPSRDSDEAQFSDEEAGDSGFDPAALPDSTQSVDMKRKVSADSSRSDGSTGGRMARPSFKPLEEALVTDSTAELMLHPDFK